MFMYGGILLMCENFIVENDVECVEFLGLQGKNTIIVILLINV